jgi:aminopeptidase N
MADANDVNLSQFERWYSQAGTPELHVTTQWHDQEGVLDVSLEQRYAPHPYNVPGTQDRQPLLAPIAIGFLDSSGQELTASLWEGGETADGLASGPNLVPRNGASQEPARTHVLALREAQQVFRFRGFQAMPVLSLLRGYSAPVKLKMHRGRRTLALLMGHDPDPFSRWDASQDIAMQVLLELIANVQQDRLLRLDPVFVEAFGNLLVDPDLDGSFKSLLMTMPGESVVGQEFETIDTDAIHVACRFLRSHLAGIYRAQLLELYRANRRDEPYKNDAASIQRRRLKNTALGYLTALEEQEFTSLALVQFRTANNMTDQQAALTVLNQQPASERQEVLQAFYKQWHGDPLVLDKWFAVQALCELPGTVKRVRKLTEHPDFQWRNPNRVRALLGTFGTLNQFAFHQADGSGYELLADGVWKVDDLNPQVAARLVSPFNSWKRFDVPRQRQMKQQLERLRSKPNLSKDVREIVERAL